MDIAALRSDTPGTEHVTHLNNAGAALQPEPVLAAVRDYLALEAIKGGYEVEALHAPQTAAVYDALAELLHTSPSNIALSDSATSAYNTALSAIPFRPGDVILTTRNDYASNQIAFLSLKTRFGVEVVRAPDLPEGGVDPLAAEEIIHRRRPRLVAVSHVPTSSGLIQPVEAIGQACRERGIVYLVDACQSVGQMEIDVEAIGCDFLSATGRKFLRGPRGTGFLYVSDRALDDGLEPLFPDMRAADWIDDDLYQPAPDARRFESWEFNHALVLGLGAAVRYALEIGQRSIEARVMELAAAAREALAGVPGVRVLDQGTRLAGIVTAAVSQWEAPALVDALRERAIHTSAVDVTSAIFDFADKGITTALRVSPHYYNTLDEIGRLVDALTDLGK